MHGSCSHLGSLGTSSVDTSVVVCRVCIVISPFTSFCSPANSKICHVYHVLVCLTLPADSGHNRFKARQTSQRRTWPAARYYLRHLRRRSQHARQGDLRRTAADRNFTAVDGPWRMVRSKGTHLPPTRGRAVRGCYGPAWGWTYKHNPTICPAL